MKTDNRAIRTADGARAIIEHNIYTIYHLPTRYQALNRALKDVRQDLLSILNYIKDIEPIIYRQQYCWYLDNGALTNKVRKRTTKATSNRRLNYLFCIGVLRKIKQTEHNMIGINMEFMLESGINRPMNVLTVYRYTDKELGKLENRAKILLEHGITAGNISRDKLVASGCIELADEVYYANSKTSIQRKDKLYNKLTLCLDTLISEQGYCTKSQLCIVLSWQRDKLDNIMRVYAMQWQQCYTYKAPNNTDIEQYGLLTKKWIIKKKEK